MATGGQFRKSLKEASGAIHYFPCFPCSEDGNNAKALYKCVDCKTCYCQRCLYGHNRFIKNHTVLDLNCMKPGQSESCPLTTAPLEMCAEHQGRTIEMYCKEHDNVCCSVCIAMEHRSCESLQFIPHVAKKLLKEQDRDKLKSSLEDITKDLRLLRLKQSDFLQKLNQQRNSSLKEIQQFKAQLVNRVNELERSSISEVEKRYTAVTEDINHDIEIVVQMLNDAEIHLNKVRRLRNHDDATQCISIKLAERQVSRSSDCLDAYFGKPLEQIDYKLNTSIEKNLEDVVSIGFLNESHKTITPFVNIVVPNPDDVTNAFTSSIQFDLLSVGVRSKFIKSCDVVADVYTVVVISCLHDLVHLNVKSDHYWKRLILFKLRVRPVSFFQSIIAGNRFGNAAQRANIPFERCENNEYTFDQSKKDHALRLVYDTAIKNALNIDAYV